MSNRRLVGLCAAISLTFAALGTTVGVAVANHDWSDVDTGTFFHDVISEITGAGCARGFQDGTFLPEDAVKRQQFAFWLNNCGGRVAFAESAPGRDFVVEGDLIDDLVQVQIETGGAPDIDAAGLIFVMADVGIQTSDDQQTTWRLVQGTGVGSLEVDSEVLGVTPPVPGAGALSPTAGTTLATVVRSGADTLETFRVTVERENGAPNGLVEATITAMYFPFDGLGHAVQISS